MNYFFERTLFETGSSVVLLLIFKPQIHWTDGGLRLVKNYSPVPATHANTRTPRAKNLFIIYSIIRFIHSIFFLFYAYNSDIVTCMT